MSSYVFITGTMRHIFEKSAEIMRDIKYKNNWLFCHDALTVMKVEDYKDCRKGT